jgi:hypothetical protein
VVTRGERPRAPAVEGTGGMGCTGSFTGASARSPGRKLTSRAGLV